MISHRLEGPRTPIRFSCLLALAVVGFAALLGPGVIIDIGRIDVRFGLHFGITAAAADVVLDAWTSTAVALRR